MVIDLWVNSISKRAAEKFLGQKGFGAIEGFFGSQIQGGMTTGDLLGEMDRLGVDRAVELAAIGSSRPVDAVVHRVRNALLARPLDD